MPNYSYTVLKPDGRQLKKTMTCESEAELRNMVQRNGDIVIDIVSKGALYKDIDISRRPGPKELGIFCTQMNSILRAGVPAIEALNMVLDTTKNTKLKNAIIAVINDVNAGIFISDAMSKHPDIFPLVMVQMIKAGEASGRLTEIFARLGKQFEKEFKLKNSVKKALAYPKMIIAVMIIALIVVCVVVVPMFVDIFKELNTELPITTKFFIALSELFTSKWYVLVIIVVTAFASYKLIMNTDKGKRGMAQLKLKLPMIKSLVIKTESANFSRIFSTLLSSGKDYPDSLDITKDTINNIIIKEAVERVNENVKQGTGLTSAMKKEAIFPELLISMCNIGENTGRVGEMLENAASYFEEEVETTTMRITSAIQPIIIVVLGVFVGLLVYSIYSPMFSMYQGIG